MTLHWIQVQDDTHIASCPSGGFYTISAPVDRFTAVAWWKRSHDAEPETVYAGTSLEEMKIACAKDAEDRETRAKQDKRRARWADYMAKNDPPTHFNFTVNPGLKCA